MAPLWALSVILLVSVYLGEGQEVYDRERRASGRPERNRSALIRRRKDVAMDEWCSPTALAPATIIWASFGPWRFGGDEGSRGQDTICSSSHLLVSACSQLLLSISVLARFYEPSQSASNPNTTLFASTGPGHPSCRNCDVGGCKWIRDPCGLYPFALLAIEWK